MDPTTRGGRRSPRARRALPLIAAAVLVAAWASAVIDANHAWADLFSSTPGNSNEAGLALTSDGGLRWSQVGTPQPS